MDSTQAFLENTNEFEDVHWEPSRELYIVHNLDGDNGQEIGFMAPSSQDLYSEHWSAMIIEQEYVPGVPPLCDYPIFGVLESIIEDLAVLHTEPILEYQSYNLDEFDSIYRQFGYSIFILDPNNIGGLTFFLFSIEEFGFSEQFMIYLISQPTIQNLSSIDNNSFLGTPLSMTFLRFL